MATVRVFYEFSPVGDPDPIADSRIERAAGQRKCGASSGHRDRDLEFRASSDHEARSMAARIRAVEPRVEVVVEPTP